MGAQIESTHCVEHHFGLRDHLLGVLDKCVVHRLPGLREARLFVIVKIDVRNRQRANDGEHHHDDRRPEQQQLIAEIFQKRQKGTDALRFVGGCLLLPVDLHPHHTDGRQRGKNDIPKDSQPLSRVGSPHLRRRQIAGEQIHAAQNHPDHQGTKQRGKCPRRRATQPVQASTHQRLRASDMDQGHGQRKHHRAIGPIRMDQAEIPEGRGRCSDDGPSQHVGARFCPFAIGDHAGVKNRPGADQHQVPNHHPHPGRQDRADTGKKEANRQHHQAESKATDQRRTCLEMRKNRHDQAERDTEPRGNRIEIQRVGIHDPIIPNAGESACLLAAADIGMPGCRCRHGVRGGHLPRPATGALGGKSGGA